VIDRTQVYVNKCIEIGKFKTVWAKAVFSSYMYYSDLCLEGPKNTTVNISK
jgi:hypothetical protein